MAAAFVVATVAVIVVVAVAWNVVAFVVKFVISGDGGERAAGGGGRDRGRCRSWVTDRGL